MNPATTSFGNEYTRTLISSIVGGTMSHLTGGSFANGAATSMLQWWFNAEKMGIIEGLKNAKKVIYEGVRPYLRDVWGARGVYSIGLEATVVQGHLGLKGAMGVAYDFENSDFLVWEKNGVSNDVLDLSGIDTWGSEVSLGITFDWSPGIDKFLGQSVDYSGSLFMNTGYDFSISNSEIVTKGFDVGIGSGYSAMPVCTNILGDRANC